MHPGIAREEEPSAGVSADYHPTRQREDGAARETGCRRECFLNFVYSGTPLLWTPWGRGEVSCIQWNSSIVDTLGTW